MSNHVVILIGAVPILLPSADIGTCTTAQPFQIGLPNCLNHIQVILCSTFDSALSLPELLNGSSFDGPILMTRPVVRAVELAWRELATFNGSANEVMHSSHGMCTDIGVTSNRNIHNSTTIVNELSAEQTVGNRFSSLSNEQHLLRVRKLIQPVSRGERVSINVRTSRSHHAREQSLVFSSLSSSCHVGAVNWIVHYMDQSYGILHAPSTVSDYLDVMKLHQHALDDNIHALTRCSKVLITQSYLHRVILPRATTTVSSDATSTHIRLGFKPRILGLLDQILHLASRHRLILFPISLHPLLLQLLEVIYFGLQDRLSSGLDKDHTSHETSSIREGTMPAIRIVLASEFAEKFIQNANFDVEWLHDSYQSSIGESEVVTKAAHAIKQRKIQIITKRNTLEAIVRSSAQTTKANCSQGGPVNIKQCTVIFATDSLFSPGSYAHTIQTIWSTSMNETDGTSTTPIHLDINSKSETNNTTSSIQPNSLPIVTIPGIATTPTTGYSNGFALQDRSSYVFSYEIGWHSDLHDVISILGRLSHRTHLLVEKSVQQSPVIWSREVADIIQRNVLTKQNVAHANSAGACTSEDLGNYVKLLLQQHTMLVTDNQVLTIEHAIVACASVAPSHANVQQLKHRFSIDPSNRPEWIPPNMCVFSILLPEYFYASMAPSVAARLQLRPWPLNHIHSKYDGVSLANYEQGSVVLAAELSTPKKRSRLNNEAVAETELYAHPLPSPMSAGTTSFSYTVS